MMQGVAQRVSKRKAIVTTNSGESEPQPLFFERVSAKKSSKRNAVLWGAAPLPATFEKVDETFKLSNP